MKKVIVFDLDGTLAPSKSPLPDRMAEVLSQLLDVFHVCVISGGKFAQFEKQLLGNLQVDAAKLKRLHLMPTCGTRYYIFDELAAAWKQVYAEDFTKKEKTKIMAALHRGAQELGIIEREVYGALVEDRGSQITYSALGQDIVDVLKEEGVRRKEAWDPDNSKKNALRDHIAKLIPEFEVRVGGVTSIDVTKLGIDKAYGVKRLGEILGVAKHEMLFIGDRLQEGGNDYPVKASGVDSLEIGSWQETAAALKALLFLAPERAEL